MKIPNEPTRTFLKILRPDALSRDLRDFLLDVQAANRTDGTARSTCSDRQAI